MSKTTSLKSRHWRLEFYPDSAPQNWKEILEDTFLPIAVSPLHDQDVKEDGSPKKPHYHVIVTFPNTTTSGKALAIADALNAPHCVLPADSLAGAYWYFIHKYQKEKHQYNECDIIVLNGFEAPEDKKKPKVDLEKAGLEDASLFKLIRDEGCYNLGMLIDTLFQYGLYDKYAEVKKNSYFWGQICKSVLETPHLNDVVNKSQREYKSAVADCERTQAKLKTTLENYERMQSILLSKPSLMKQLGAEEQIFIYNERNNIYENHN